MIFFEINEKSLKEEAEKTKKQINLIYNKLTMISIVIFNFFILIIFIYLISYNYSLSKKYSKLVNELQEITLNYKIFSSKLTTYYSKDYIQKVIKTHLYLPSTFVFIYNNDKILINKLNENK